MYFVYILRTSSNTLYIEQTNNLKKDLTNTKKKLSKSAKYIRYFSSFDLVYKESYATRTEAMRRESQLKKWPKAKKEVLINGEYHELKHLSRSRHNVESKAKNTTFHNHFNKSTPK